MGVREMQEWRGISEEKEKKWLREKESSLTSETPH